MPWANAEEAGLVPDAEIYLTEWLCDVAEAPNGRQSLPRAEPAPRCELFDVPGQHRARRALESAARPVCTISC